MDTKLVILVAFVILVLVAVAFFAVFRGKGKLRIKGPGGIALNAEGENPPPQAAVSAGVRIKGAEAGRDLHAESIGAGGVDLENVKAKGDIGATSSQGSSSSPKT
jgi:hypothetical protein